jgi:hypothetical protein
VIVCRRVTALVLRSPGLRFSKPRPKKTDEGGYQRWGRRLWLHRLGLGTARESTFCADGTFSANRYEMRPASWIPQGRLGRAKDELTDCNPSTKSETFFARANATLEEGWACFASPFSRSTYQPPRQRLLTHRAMSGATPAGRYVRQVIGSPRKSSRMGQANQRTVLRFLRRARNPTFLRSIHEPIRDQITFQIMRLKDGFKSIKLALHLSPSDRFRSIGNSAKNRHAHVKRM